MKKYLELTQHERDQIVGFAIPDNGPVVEHDGPVDREEAIMEIIDAMTEVRPLRDRLHETIEVCGYAPPTIRRSLLRPLDHLLEVMGELYQHPDDDWSEVTQGMRDAEKVFLDKVIEEYTVTNVVEVCSDEIQIGEFVKEHCAHWLYGEDEEG